MAKANKNSNTGANAAYEAELGSSDRDREGILQLLSIRDRWTNLNFK